MPTINQLVRKGRKKMKKTAVMRHICRRAHKNAVYAHVFILRLPKA